jgi:hypothetical protein
LLVLATVQNQPVVLTAAEPSVIEPGATLDELVAHTGTRRDLMRTVLVRELALGRVVLAPDGRYRLVASAFPPGVLAALRSFSRPPTAALNGRSHPPERGGRLNPHERDLLDRVSLLPSIGDGLVARRARVDGS